VVGFDEPQSYFLRVHAQAATQVLNLDHEIETITHLGVALFMMEL